MEKIYFEVSAINRAVDEHRSPDSLLQSLEKRGELPTIGIHAIYELAKTFLKPKGIDRGKALFRFVQGLDPSYSPPVRNLLAQEVAKLRLGIAVLPFLNHINQTSAKNEVGRLALGSFDERARSFITLREEVVRYGHPQMANNYIRYIQEFTKRNPKKLSGIRSFENTYQHFQSKIPEIIQEILVKEQITYSEAREFAIRLNSFPALRSVVNANVYLMFVCITQQVVPNSDKLDDHRHIIEASYCNGIVTQDTQLRTNANRINPDIKVLCLANLT